MIKNHGWALYGALKTNLKLWQIVEDLEGEMPPDIEAALRENDCKRDDILEDAICTLKNLDALAELHAAEIKRLGDRRRAIQSRYETLHEWLGTAISPDGFSRGVHSAKWAKCPPSVEIKDPAAVPIEFLDYEPKIKKVAIKDAMEAGATFDWARLIKDKKTLRIK